MKAVLVDLPEKDEAMFSALLKRLGLRSRTLSSEQLEDRATAEWILEGAVSEEISEDDVLQTLRSRGVEV
jgi:hypothetical protein